MTEFEERMVAGLKVRIDRYLCVGFETCVDEAPEAFALDADGVAIFVDGTDPPVEERLLDACRSCPVDAISVYDERGRQLVP